MEQNPFTQSASQPPLAPPSQGGGFLTATDIYKFIQCPHWPYYDRFATEEEQKLRRELTEGELKRMENGVLHEKEVVAKLTQGVEIAEPAISREAETDFESTLSLMKRGVPMIYQGTLTSGTRAGRPDLLERREGASLLGDWYYIPVDVKSTHEIEKYQRFQLVFYSELLESIQGRFPEEAAIINADQERLPFNPADQHAEFDEFVLQIEALLRGEKPDPILRKSCYDTGPWGKVCEQFAKATNDIALLYNVDIKKLRALRSLGVRSVSDAAEMDPSALAGTAKGLTVHGLETIKRQAQSLGTGQVIVRKPVVLPSEGLEIHFDIESDPPNDVDYLYGFLIRNPEGDEYKSFVADSLEKEGEMWAEFLAWLETLPPEYTVYHFSAYEVARLRVLEKRYGGSEWLEKFRTKLFDLKEPFIHSITIPSYFYGLKYIAKFLGFSWRNALVTSGGVSVDQFERFLESGDRAILDAIIMYNEDDVRATAFVKDWLVNYAKEVTAYDMPYPWTK